MYKCINANNLYEAHRGVICNWLAEHRYLEHFANSCCYDNGAALKLACVWVTEREREEGRESTAVNRSVKVTSEHSSSLEGARHCVVTRRASVRALCHATGEADGLRRWCQGRNKIKKTNKSLTSDPRETPTSLHPSVSQRRGGAVI